jgi:cytidyltransferase-like protein
MTKAQQVVVVGGFDDLKSRDIRFLEEASKLGNLTALLWSDKLFHRIEGKASKFPENERLYFLRAIRYVDRVELVQDQPDASTLPDVAGLKPQIWAMQSEDAAKKKFCESRGIGYRVLTGKALDGFPDVSSASESAPRKKVIVTGCYDWFHSGHVRFFEEASAVGDLYVVVGHDENVRLLKGEGRPLFPAEERRYVVGAIRFVRRALVSTGSGWMDAEPEIRQIKPDIYLVNEDGDVPIKREYCQQHGLEYVVLKRKPAQGLPRRSSTDLRGF